MRIKLTKPIAVLAIGSTALLGLADTAGASTPVPANGQDGIHNIVTAGGSDTTYVVDGEISTLYNQSPGCKTQNSLSVTTAPLTADCLLGAAQNNPQANFNDNGDHEVITHVYPTGSSAGIGGLTSTPALYDFARSSRTGSAGELANSNFWGFAKDAIAVGTLPGRATGNFTKAQLQGVYNCTITTWGALTGTADTTPIRPYAMNTSSGTFATFQAYLGFDPNAGTCVNKLLDGTAPFENDWKPVIADAAARVSGGNATYASTNIIWFGSFGEFKTYPYKAPGVGVWGFNNGTTNVPVQNSTIANDSYPITRFLYRVAKKTTIDLTGTNGANLQISDTGATSGSAGGARGYIKWACQPSSYFDAAGTTTALNPYNGATYFTGITNAITNSGFQRVPAAQRTVGACNLNV